MMSDSSHTSFLYFVINFLELEPGMVNGKWVPREMNLREGGSSLSEVR